MYTHTHTKANIKQIKQQQAAAMDGSRGSRRKRNQVSLRGSSVKLGTIQRTLAWPPRKNDTHKSRSVHNFA